jgi:hypothetical protein
MRRLYNLRYKYTQSRLSPVWHCVRIVFVLGHHVRAIGLMITASGPV